ncbi:formimidoylglutamate deiminase [Cryobacterium sp. PH29-G1]|uniref:formimidoylglutamate deiminase n=1 Tax=Cryobacterium sp. PH29-G1 TaxID=3046211 RepID=UPI0024B887E7|nr:formimidoylglutamate deiminase [Cryobacterium sp. PH29-G1]MDJ0348368.1 formimidoylglutamate deiminase [Cryobacterium sp. PH29-G1]
MPGQLGGLAEIATATSFWCESLLVEGIAVASVRLEVDAGGRISRVQPGVAPETTDTRLGTVLPGFGNAHSHAFHRALRGRTHGEGGDFWLWRESMYRIAAQLDPESYQALATAVFAEMLASGYTAVGEFHYLHHHRDGEPYVPAHAMELALASAARAVGIRLVLLDTVYLQGAIGRELAPNQRAFGDEGVAGWLARWKSLRSRLADNDLVTLGAAVHSVRAVTPDAMRNVFAGLPPEIPVHIHLSEQPQENADCEIEYGLTPAGLLDSIDALTPRLSVVHATHLSDDDRALLGFARVTVVMCPTTEADLGDGIGPALALAHSGSPIALGSDQNAVIDPFLEMRGLEMGERLASQKRGRFAPAELLTAASTAGYSALGLGRHRLQPGDPCDLVEISTTSVRTSGSLPEQLALTASASDVMRVFVGGRLVADSGQLIGGIRPAALMTDALQRLALRQAD